MESSLFLKSAFKSAYIGGFAQQTELNHDFVIRFEALVPFAQDHSIHSRSNRCDDFYNNDCGSHAKANNIGILAHVI